MKPIFAPHFIPHVGTGTAKTVTISLGVVIVCPTTRLASPKQMGVSKSPLPLKTILWNDCFKLRFDHKQRFLSQPFFAYFQIPFFRISIYSFQIRADLELYFRQRSRFLPNPDAHHLSFTQKSRFSRFLGKKLMLDAQFTRWLKRFGVHPPRGYLHVPRVSNPVPQNAD